MKQPPPPGPAALYVCRESRRVALRRYELAFGGTNLVPHDEMFVAEWENGGYARKRTWVDFERDVIFVAGADLSVDNMPMRIGIPAMVVGLERLVFYAKEEVSKIRNLAVGGMWADVQTWQPGWAQPTVMLSGDQSNRFAVTMDVAVREFGMLKKLAFYHYDLTGMSANGQYGMADSQAIRRAITGYVEKKAREQVGDQGVELPAATVYHNMVRVSPNGDS